MFRDIQYSNKLDVRLRGYGVLRESGYSLRVLERKPLNTLKPTEYTAGKNIRYSVVFGNYASIDMATKVTIHKY